MFTYKVMERYEDCAPYGLLFRSMQHNVAQSKLNSFAQQPAIGKFKTTSTFQEFRTSVSFKTNWEENICYSIKEISKEIKFLAMHGHEFLKLCFGFQSE